MDIPKKQKKLESISKKLKRKYVGIDNQIDKIIEQMSMWYLYPEFQFRPTIINLFGLTGVGKTSLIRDIVKLLNYNDKYCEIELDNSNNLRNSMGYLDADNNSILSSLFSINLKPQNSGILLLDEIHRFRTIINGEYRPLNIYEDLWKLLSDGCLYDKAFIIHRLNYSLNLVKSSIQRAMSGAFESKAGRQLSIQDKIKASFGMYQQSPNSAVPSHPQNIVQQTLDAQNNVFKNPMDFHISGTRNYFNITELKNLLDFSDEDIEFIQQQKMLYQPEDIYLRMVLETFKKEPDTLDSLLESCSNQIMINFVERKIKELNNETTVSDSLDENKDEYVYSKLLIFICGNLDNDEIYKRPDRTNKDVIDELKKMFRPEQVSRFGKNFVLYPIFTKENFNEIIDKEFAIKNRYLKEKFGVELNDKVLNRVKKEIFEDETTDYKQGVRPVISSVGRILGEIIPNVLIKHSRGEDK